MAEAQEKIQKLVAHVHQLLMGINESFHILCTQIIANTKIPQPVTTIQPIQEDSAMMISQKIQPQQPINAGSTSREQHTSTRNNQTRQPQHVQWINPPNQSNHTGEVFDFYDNPSAFFSGNHSFLHDWIIDSGASSHMTPHLSLFNSYIVTDNILPVRSASGSTHAVSK